MSPGFGTAHPLPGPATQATTSTSAAPAITLPDDPEGLPARALDTWAAAGGVNTATRRAEV